MRMTIRLCHIKHKTSKTQDISCIRVEFDSRELIWRTNMCRPPFLGTTDQKRFSSNEYIKTELDENNLNFLFPLLAGIERSPACSRKDVCSRETSATIASSSSSFELNVDSEISCFLKHITKGKIDSWGRQRKTQKRQVQDLKAILQLTRFDWLFF